MAAAPAAPDSAYNGAGAELETLSSPAAADPFAAGPPASDAATQAAAAARWPGWPGDSVFRLIVPVLTVGSIIGRKGELIKKMCEETRARIRIFEGAIGTTDRIVLISGKEEPDAAVSPAMDAVIRVFKRVCGVPEGEGEAVAQVRCSIRLLVSGSQAIYLIGKQGSVIKSIQETSGASVRVLPENEVPFYAAPDERIIDIQGEYVKVLKALEAVTGQLRKFLVDHSVLPLFEKAYNTSAASDRSADIWSDKAHETTPTGISSDYSLSMKRDSLFLDREHQLEPQIPRSRLSIYGQDPTHSGPRTSGLGRVMVTQVTQTMQIPLSYAEDIIGIGGTNIAYIRRTSGAILTVQESVGMPDEITVEIKGTSSQVQTAQQLIQDCIAVHKEPSTGGYGLRDAGSGGYGSRDAGYRPYSHLPPSSYSSSIPSQSLDDYGPPGLGGYSRYRL